MPQPMHRPLPPLQSLLVATLVAFGATGPAPVAAEKADRGKPMIIEADKPGVWDVQRQVIVFNGNVSIAQGTMLIRAERVEVREAPDGYRSAVAFGSGTRAASYRQKRDAVDEVVEGQAERIEFDGRADTLRFTGNGVVRRLRGTTVADEIVGSLITWDNTNEVFSVAGGAASPANPSGRVRAVLSPRGEASSAPPGANAPALKPSTQLGEPR